jgi:mannitol-1-/sugar-/sorbitol-6-phosphatase
LTTTNSAATSVLCNALLFDLDGVLIDSTPAVERVWSRWATERGFDPADVVRRAHGRPSLSTIRELLPDADHEKENREVERREIEDLQGVVPLPGTAALLDALPPGRWTIVTSCTRALAEVRIRAAGLPMPARIITSTDVAHGKPHPEPYLKAAGMLGVDPHTCLVVEDAPAGIRAGKAAGARVIAFPTTASPPELRAAGADWVVANCGGLHLQQSAGDGAGLALRLTEL